MAIMLALRCVLLSTILITTTSAVDCGDGYVPVIKLDDNVLSYQDADGKVEATLDFDSDANPRMFALNLVENEGKFTGLDGVVTTASGDKTKYKTFKLSINDGKWELADGDAGEVDAKNTDKELIFFCQDNLPANTGNFKKVGDKCVFGSYKVDSAVLPQNFKTKCGGATICHYNAGSGLIRITNKTALPYEHGTFYYGTAAMVDPVMQRHWVGYGYDGHFRPVHCIGKVSDKVAYLPILKYHSFIGNSLQQQMKPLSETPKPDTKSCPADAYYQQAVREEAQDNTEEIKPHCDENAQSVEFIGFIVAMSVASLLTCLFFVAIISTRCATYCMKKDGKALPKKPWETLHTEDQTADMTIGVTENQSAYGTVTQSVMGSTMSSVNSTNNPPPAK